MIRLLPPEEWTRLIEVFAGNGLDPRTIPSPAIAKCVVEEEDGRITGFLFGQLVWHFEPLWLAAPSPAWRALYSAMSEEVGGVPHYVFAPIGSPVEKMTETVGMVRLPFSVWMKEA